MYIGVDYYPEHWPTERWETDARLMQEAGFNVVRMAEFAWVDLEPQEGQYRFDWLDRALAILAERGIAAILGTPTAAMPAWVQHRYPEVMALQKDGTRIAWGVRKNNCMSSPIYRQLSRKITRAMAEHYAQTANVIGWQTDNEFGGPICFCDGCKKTFQDWLRRKYQTLDALNAAWGTHFWGQKYGSWDEIVLPTDDAGHNPSLLLDWKRFNSWLNVTFQAEQVQILREVCPRHFITHNFMGLFYELNYYDLARDLDFVSWDNYPFLHGGEVGPTPHASAAADLMRSLKRQNFWIMETTAGPMGWGQMSRNPRPGEIRKMAFNQYAHGADHLVWFRWRTCTAGREQYWHGLLGHDGKPLRRYREAAATAADLRRLETELAGTTVRADAAILYDYESGWAFRYQPAYENNTPHRWGENYLAAAQRFYLALYRAGVNVDFIPPSADLSGYKAVLAPHLYLLPDELAARLSDYVQNGGVLLADCRTGVKNETSLCHDRTLPGLLSDALGISIEEYEALPGFDYPFEGQDSLAGSYNAHLFADWVTPTTAESLGTFTPGHMRAFAPVTRNRYGQGWGYYAGVIAREDAFYDRLIAEVLQKAGVQPILTPPEGVEASVRQGGGKQLLFLINHTEQPRRVNVPAGKTDLLTGHITGETLTLEPLGVAVLKL